MRPPAERKIESWLRIAVRLTWSHYKSGEQARKQPLHHWYSQFTECIRTTHQLAVKPARVGLHAWRLRGAYKGLSTSSELGPRFRGSTPGCVPCDV